MNDLWLHVNSYDDEYQQFQWDVYMLIINTLNASIRHLDTKAGIDLSEIKAALETSHDDEAHQHLIDEHVDILETKSGQGRFLRNMALVALSSRLTHALRNMTKSAELFSPRKKRYGNKSMGEYRCLWLEYVERFGIDFDTNADRIEFVETMRVVRNQIVHDGAEANTFKFSDQINWKSDVVDFLDCSFSEKYPEYVSGNDVSVSQEKLDEAIKSSVELVGWLAGELRERELSSFRKTKGTQ